MLNIQGVSNQLQLTCTACAGTMILEFAALSRYIVVDLLYPGIVQLTFTEHSLRWNYDSRVCSSFQVYSTVDLLYPGIVQLALTMHSLRWNYDSRVRCSIQLSKFKATENHKCQ